MIFLGFCGHPEASFELEVFDGSAGDEAQSAFLYQRPDYVTCVHDLVAMERMRSGVFIRVIHASQQASTIAS